MCSRTPTCREIDRTLRIAAFEGDLPRVQHLIQLGADVNAGEMAGSTPLLVSVGQAPIKLIRYLLEHGANANVRSHGTTVLHVAAVYGRADVVELLLGFGAYPDARKKDGSTPLMIAAGLGYVHVARCLLQHGASLDLARMSDGFTALHLACRWKHTNPKQPVHGGSGDRNLGQVFFQVVCLLVEWAYLTSGPNGANALISKQANCGRTPIDLACKYGHANIVQVLLLHKKREANPPKVDETENEQTCQKPRNVWVSCKKQARAIRDVSCSSVCTPENDGQALLGAKSSQDRSCLKTAKGIFHCLRPPV